MGWTIITNNVDKWRVESSVTESIIAEFDNENDLRRFLALDAYYRGKLKGIEEFFSYPLRWTVNDVCVRTEEAKEGYRAYLKWYDEVVKLDGDDYYQAIDRKFDELLMQSTEMLEGMVDWNPHGNGEQKGILIGEENITNPFYKHIGKNVRVTIEPIKE